MYSMGSSSVTTCTGLVLQMRSITEASVVDLPEPVSPVTRMRPLCMSMKRPRTFGRPSTSIGGISSESRRNAMDRTPCWRNTFTRQRTPAIVRAVSASPHSCTRSHTRTPTICSA